MWLNSHKFYNLANTTMPVLVYPCITMDWVFFTLTSYRILGDVNHLWKYPQPEINLTSYGKL